MSRVTRAVSGKNKDVRAEESHSQEQIGTNIDVETNADNDALIDETIDNAEEISARGKGTMPQRDDEEEESNSPGDSDPIRARQVNIDGAAAGGDGVRTQAQGLPTMEEFMRILSQERDVQMRMMRERDERADEIIQQLLHENSINHDRISALELDLIAASHRDAAIIVEPVITLPELPAGVILKNRNGDTVDVTPSFYIITPPVAGTISELAQTQIEVPKLDAKKVKAGMDGGSWLAFARALVQYWNVGGNKKITAFIDNEIIGALAMLLKFSTNDFAALSNQLLIYEILKMWYVKPQNDLSKLFQDIKSIKLLPTEEKGSMEFLTIFFIQAMSKLVTVPYTKDIMKLIMGQVFISQWENEFKAKTFESFKDFYEFIQELALKYDVSDSNTIKLTSSYKSKNGNGANGGKNGNNHDKGNDAAAGGAGNGNGGAKPKREAKCVICGQSHWAFKLHQDKGAYSKPFGDHIKWECPDVNKKSDEIKTAAWNARCKEVKDRALAYQKAKDTKA